MNFILMFKTRLKIFFIISQLIIISTFLVLCFAIFTAIKNDMEIKVQVNTDELTIKEKFLFIPIKEKKFKLKELKIEIIEIEKQYFSIIFEQEKIPLKKILNLVLSKREANYLVNKIKSLC